MKVFLLTSIVLSIVMLQGISLAGEACNAYVDGVLNDLLHDDEIFLDPYEIPEKAIELHRKIVFVNYTGEARLYDGHVYGLSTLHRDGDVVVDKKKETHLKIWLGAGELNMQCSGKLKLMGHGPEIQISGNVKYVSMKLDVTPTKKGSNPKINDFKLEDVKGLEVKVTGMGPLAFFMNSYIKTMGIVFKGIIRLAIENKLKDFMSRKVKKYEIPEDCINNVYRRSLKFR